MHLTHHVDANAPLCALIRALASRPGFVATHLPQVQVLSWDHYVASSPQIYEPSLIILAQGSKLARLGPRTLEYGAGHYLIQALSVPFMCETFATAQAPMLGVAVDIDRAVLGELVQSMALPPDPAVQVQTPQSMSSAALDAAMRASVERLLECLQDPMDAKVLGPTRVREVLYTALRGPQAGVLRALVEQQGHFARIGSALAYLREHYAEPLSVEALASRANMSVSTFHDHDLPRPLQALHGACTDAVPQAPAPAQGAADADRRAPGRGPGGASRGLPEHLAVQPRVQAPVRPQPGR